MEKVITMTEQLAISQNTTINTLEGGPTSPVLYLSSEEIGWEGLEVQAFHEPEEYELGIMPAVPVTSLVLVTQGAMRIGLRNPNGPWRESDVRHGDLLFKPGGSEANEVRWSSLSSEPPQTLQVHLNNDLVARTAEEVAGYDLSRLTWTIGYPGFQDPLLTQILLALQRELEQPNPASNLYAQTAAQLLAVHLLRHYTRETQDSPREPVESSLSLTRYQMKQVIEFMQAHLDQTLSLDVLAQQIGFSPYHFARLFRQALGESPHQFVLHQRIERAQHLLKKTDVPLAHIAVECGFASQSHLTQVFKRHLGLTPRAYRQDR
jgi:AraC family transcriptional regulator